MAIIASPQPIFDRQPDGRRQLPPSVAMGEQTWYMKTVQVAPSPLVSTFTYGIFPDRIQQPTAVPQSTGAPPWYMATKQVAPSPVPKTPVWGIYPERVWQPTAVPQAIGPTTTFGGGIRPGTPTTVSPQAIWPDIVWQPTAIPQGVGPTATFGGGIRPGTPLIAPPIPIFPERIWQATRVPEGYITATFGGGIRPGLPLIVSPTPVFPDRIWQPTAVPQNTTGVQTWYMGTAQITPTSTPPQPVFPDRVWQPTAIPQGMTTFYQATFQPIPIPPAPIVATFYLPLGGGSAVPNTKKKHRWETSGFAYYKTSAPLTDAVNRQLYGLSPLKAKNPWKGRGPVAEQIPVADDGSTYASRMAGLQSGLKKIAEHHRKILADDDAVLELMD
jgi:hypothetical protein